MQKPNNNRYWGEIAFLLLSFFTGLIYFNVIVNGLAIGFSTLIIWIGLPILFATFYAIRFMAEAERRMVSSMLGQPYPGTPVFRPQAQGFLRRFGALLRDPYTWSSTLYLLLKLPLGIFAFTFVLTAGLISLCLTFLPLYYLLNAFITGIATGDSTLIPGLVVVHNGLIDWRVFISTFGFIPLGILCSLLTRRAIHGLATASAVIAHAMLGPSTVSYPMQPQTPSFTLAPTLYARPAGNPAPEIEIVQYQEIRRTTD